MLVASPRVLLWGFGGMCSALRLGFAADALASHGGVDIRVGRPDLVWNCDFRYECEQSPPWARVIGLGSAPDFDVLVMHGASHLWALDALCLLQRAGVRVVVDVDDLYDEVPGTNRASRLLDPDHSPFRNWRIIHRLCETADVVTAATPLLASHFGYGHGVVLPNLVPASYLEISPAQRRDVIGWTGVLSAHEGDLEQTGGAVGQILDARSDWQFGSIGGRTERYAQDIKEALGLTSEPFLQRFAHILRYPYLMAEFGIGIVPFGSAPLQCSEVGTQDVPACRSRCASRGKSHARQSAIALAGGWSDRLISRRVAAMPRASARRSGCPS